MYRREFEKVLTLLTDAAREVYGRRLVSLAVFGSVARGAPRPDSDIDLLLVVENLPFGRMKRIAEFSGVEELITSRLTGLKRINLDFSPVIKEKNEVLQGSLLFLDMVDHVKILYDRGNFLSLYLAGLKEKLQKMGARKFYRGGSWYWVLKQDYRPDEVIEI
jgi:predicted nucleotidyltransferase